MLKYDAVKEEVYEMYKNISGDFFVSDLNWL